MQRLLRLRPSPAPIIVCLSLVLAAGGVAYARVSSAPSKPGTRTRIHGCIRPGGDEVSIPPPGTGCPAGGAAISWSQA
ncbi:MAG: hypothetical protein ACRDLV_09835, partial [Solirubrobacteraceae bacterium]